jgi:leucyl-tRNA synthetase
MILVNAIYDAGKVGKENFENLLLLLSPFATETSQELWTKLGHNDQIATQ